MAVIYLRSGDGSDASDGLTWANAKATLAAALTAAGAGGTVYVSDNHAETAAANKTLTSPGTAASPVTVLCVDDTAEPPTALATTGTVTSTGGNQILFAGFAYCYGVTFSSAGEIRAVSGSAWWWRFEACSLALAGADPASVFRIGANPNGDGDDQGIELCNTTLSFSHVSQTVQYRGATFRWTCTGSALAGAAVPTTLLSVSGNSACGADILVSGVDLSAAGSGKTLVAGSAAAYGPVRFENCKLGSSVTLSSTPAGHGGVVVEFVNCDSADTNYRYEKYVYQGTITQESTIVRTGGASDGTTAISRKMVSTANSKFYSPLVSSPIAFWNDGTAEITATVEVVTDNVTLTDAEAWIEVEYLGTSGFPLSTFAHDRAANILATPANQTSSSETWTTTGLTTPVKQKLAVTFTPAEKGVVLIRVMLAKASTTLFFCPKADIT